MCLLWSTPDPEQHGLLQSRHTVTDIRPDGVSRGFFLLWNVLVKTVLMIKWLVTDLQKT